MISSKLKIESLIDEIKKIKDTKDIDKLRQVYLETNRNKIKIEIGKQLYRRYKATGNISECIKILEEICSLINSRFYKKILQNCKEKLELLNDPVYVPNNYNMISSKYEVANKNNNKILYVLNTSIPYIISGYSIRSKYIIENQKENNIQPIVITRPGFPNDFEKDTLKYNKDLMKENVNGIDYYRCLPNLFMRNTPIKEYLDEYTKKICEVVELEKPSIIHAASNYINGLAALKAARKMNLPFIYEIRGFWELTTVSKEPIFENSEEFRLAKKMETYLAYEADKIIVISHTLKNELIARGVNPDKIFIVPNGTAVKDFNKDIKNEKLINKYKLKNKFVIGYIGSIVKYEGLENLITVLKSLKDKSYKNIILMIIGNGVYKYELEKLTQELELQDNVIFIKGIPHEEVINYYSIFDLCVYCRLDELVTQMVTPLKPLEAMAYGKVVVGSNLRALKEIIVDNVNGLIFNNTKEDLETKIIEIYNNRQLKNIIGTKAREWIEENRDWKILIKKYKTIYEMILEK